MRHSDKNFLESHTMFVTIVHIFINEVSHYVISKPFRQKNVIWQIVQDSYASHGHNDNTNTQMALYI